MKKSRSFDRLDQKYLDKLVSRAATGDSNAFAELFAAISDRQLYYIVKVTGNREAAASELTEVFERVHSRLESMSNHELFTVWISRITAEIILSESDDNDDGNTYTIGTIMNLPLIESQIYLMYGIHHLSIDEIADVLNIDVKSVKRFLRSASKHLHEEAPVISMGGRAECPDQYVPLSSAESSRILEDVFERTGSDINTVPVSDLTLYTIYRSERFNVQRTILTAGLIIFLMLPLCFITPRFTMSESAGSVNGLPEYDIAVSSGLPVSRVIAMIGERNLPVYEEGPGKYTIEPTGNGHMAVSVELLNRQKTVRVTKVDSVDSEGPQLTGNTPGRNTITLTAEDSGIGIDYHNIYAENETHERIYPVSADEKQGIIFDYPEEDWDIYIPDRLGNTLHLRLNLN